MKQPKDETVTLEQTQEVEMIVVDEEMNVVEAVEQEEQQQNTNIHPQIVMTEAKLKLQGPRQLILDTETTGFYFQDGDRIIEVGAIEMINRKLTGSSIHIYINPEKPVGDSVQVHGITDEFWSTNQNMQKLQIPYLNT